MKWVIENEKVDKKDTKVAHHKSIMIHITNDTRTQLAPIASDLSPWQYEP